jgi:hypothetical protein
MGRCDCFASLLIVGAALKSVIDELLKFVAAQPPAGTLLFGVSPMNTSLMNTGSIDNGVIIRVAGDSSEAVMMWLRERMTFLIGALGGDPWSRKR